MNDSRPVAGATGHGFAKLMPDVDRERAWLLTVDGAPQSYVDLDEPTHLEFEYVRRVGHALDVVAEPGRALDVVHLGGGALTLPRYVAATRPGSRQHVVELDGALLDLVLEHLPTPAGAGITAHAADARAWLDAARVLRGDGVYLANLADAAPFAFLRSQLANLATVFEELALIAEPAVLRGRRFGNAVLVAAHRPVDTAALARLTASDAFPARVEHGAGVRAFMGAARPVRDEDAVPSPEPPEGAFGIG
ncbi:spermidine synthase [Streptomyces sp. NPDC054756]